MGKSENLSKKTFSGFIWRFLEQCGSQGVSFIVSIVLARLLEPSVYGIVALVAVFISILNVFINSGMGVALIQKKDADDLDFSSLFYFNLAMCTLLYIIMFFAAPHIANFYAMPDLTPVVRVMSLTLIVSGVKGIQQSYVSRHMLFKKFFFATLGGTIFSAFVGIWMAYKGYGVWALVTQSLSNNVIDTVILWFMVKWRPKLMFSLQRIKGLFSFGWKLLVSSLLDRAYKSLRTLIIGKVYSAADLAQYNKGKSWPSLIVENINASIDSVLLPAMSKHQDNPEAVKAMTRRSIKTSTYLMAPLLLGLAFIGEPLVRLVLTEKWMPSVFFMRIICVTCMFYPVHTANLNAIKAMGRSDLFLRLEVTKKIVGLAIVAATMFISVKAIAWGSIVSSIASQIINASPNKKLMNYGYIEQLKDILPGILLACVMGVMIYPIQFLGLSDLITLLIQVPLGAVVFIAFSKILHIDSFEYVLSLVKGFVNKNKEKED